MEIILTAALRILFLGMMLTMTVYKTIQITVLLSKKLTINSKTMTAALILHHSDGKQTPDADGDGFADYADLCPTQPETFNGIDDKDGCPDEISQLDSDQDGISDSS